MQTRTITLFYDGSPYVFQWLKTLLWVKKELSEQGIRVEFKSMYQFLPIKKDNNKIISAFNSKQYDIVALAFHHSTSMLGLSNEIERRRVLEQIKNNCNYLIWLDTADSTGTSLFDVLPIVDVYLKKQLLRDENLYEREIWGSRLYCEYYHKLLNIDDKEITSRQYPVLDGRLKHKIRLAWNLGLGDIFVAKRHYAYLRPQSLANLNDSEKKFDSRKFDVHFRGSCWSSVCGYQRAQCKALLGAKKGITIPDVNSKISKNDYQEELRNSKSVISPFGWGEICFRDFEAFACSAALIKPSMSHLKTFPDWYVENETYIPLNWNFNNFDEVVDGLRNDVSRYKIIAKNGNELLRYYRESLEAKKNFVQHFLKSIFEIA